MAPGVGVMIHQLFGSSDGVGGAVGKVIASIDTTNDVLTLAFTDGSVLEIWDGGQSCCEARYMRTDDELPYFTGATLLGAEVRAAEDLPAEYAVHEVQFLDIKTDRGVFTCSNHNEHNGYYGGFDVRTRFTPATEVQS